MKESKIIEFKEKMTDSFLKTVRLTRIMAQETFFLA